MSQKSMSTAQPILLFFLVLTYLHFTSALVVYAITTSSPLNITYTPTSLTSFYSSIGAFPSASISANLSLLSSTDVNSADCSIRKNISGSVVIYSEIKLPTLQGCNHDAHAEAAAFARTVQKYGGLALVLIAAEKHIDGRIIGLTKTISIPVLVAPETEVQYVIGNEDLISRVEVPPANTSDIDFANLCYSKFEVATSVFAFVYSLLVLAFGIVLVADLRLMFAKGKYFSHSTFLRLFCIVCAVLNIFRCTIDPFNFNGYPFYYSTLINSLQSGLVINITLLVLRIWIKAPMVSHFTAWSRFIYTFVATMTICVVLGGLLWYIYWVQFIGGIIAVIGVVVGYAGHIYFGKIVLTVIAKSGNKSPEGKLLPIKILIFIILYGGVIYCVIIVSFTSPLGYIFGEFITSFMNSVVLFAVLVILFSTKILRRRAKKPPQQQIFPKRTLNVLAVDDSVTVSSHYERVEK